MNATIETTDLMDKAEISDGQVLVQYSHTEAALAELRHKYACATFDLTTTKGDKEARAARLELVTLRTTLEKRRKEFKAPALEFGKKIDTEAARITSEIKALETPIDDQINADETRRAAEKAERERIEAERVAAHQSRLNAMRSCVARAHGLPSERIANGIAQVKGIVLGVTVWEEFAADAAVAKQETLTAMRAMFDAAKAQEDEQARVEAQRLENEIIAAENRAAAERLAEQQRALDAQAAAIKAEQDALESCRKGEADRIEREHAAKVEVEREAAELADQAEAKRATEGPMNPLAARHEAQVAKPAVQAYDNGAPIYSATTFKDNGQPIMLDRDGKRSVFCDIADDPEPIDDGKRINLTEINDRLAPVSITVAGLSQMGFEPIEKVKASRLYRASDFPAMCQAISAHVLAGANARGAEAE